MMNSVGIIGFGRFGRVLGQILSDDFKVKAFDIKQQEPQFGVEFVNLETILQEKIIFISVPIRDLKNVIMDIAPNLQKGTTVLDVCSVKVYPVTVMTEALPSHVGIIATHPLFGPDSITIPNGHKIIMHRTRDVYNQFDFWKDYFASKAFEAIEMSPEEHDKLAAYSQGVTHFIGRILKETGITSTEIDTVGFRTLLDVIDQTCNDSWQLFCDLENYNPYSLRMMENLENSIEKVRAQILRRN
ncbi:MAG: prephenate dehydrogenase/arogenate dehydrogenase family protein [Candidatus Marinimicrobia bacterium]|nr:prephenate dehydrogenase/arogenate dehydrogenase family protein [Candidatus Neomarinimicrobiota bacterium]